MAPTPTEASTQHPGKSNNKTVWIVLAVLLGGGALLSCAVVGLLMAILLPALGAARTAAQSTQTMANLRQVGVMTFAYTNDWEVFPAGDRWHNSALTPYGMNASLLTSAHTPQAGRAFAMNAAMSSVKPQHLIEPHRTVLLFECASGSPSMGGRELMAPDPRHPSGYLILFADGYVEPVPAIELDDLHWSPRR